MPINITMPALSPTMTEGTLAKWLVKQGDAVSSGDVLCEIETDKATMEVEAVDEGIVGKLVVAEGTEGVAVNSVIAVLVEEGEEVGEVSVAPAPTAPTAASVEKPEPTPEAKAPDAKAPTAAASGDRLRASPLARRLARDAGIDLSVLKGSGPKGRIVKADVLSASAAAQPTAAPTPTATASASGPDPIAIADAFGVSYETEKVNGMRRTIAARLTESKSTVPHFYLTIDCNIDALLDLRKQVNAGLEASGQKTSVNDFIIKASAMALKAVPEANASWAGDQIVRYHNAHISVAVAIDGGLITPVVRLAEQKSLGAISDEVKDLAGRAKDGKLKPNEYQGGTFSVSNLGMFGIKEFDAVINPPESMILAVGAGERRPIVDSNGELAVGTVMSVTLSCDHRVVDGALGARWLQAFKGFIEQPLTMLV